MGPLLRICLLLAVFPVLSARAGEVTTRNGVPRVELVVHNWILPEATRSDPLSRANRQVVEAFESRYPHIVRERYAETYRKDPETYGDHDWSAISLHTRTFAGLRVEGVESDLLAIAGGVAPDVMYLNFRRSDTYIRNGFLAPLDPYLSSLSEEEWERRVHPKTLPVIRREGPEGKVHTWALPYGGLLGKGLLYRKDRFEEAGLAFPDADWTWQDLLAACRVLTDPAGGRYGIRLARGSHESFHFMSFLWSAGGDFMVRDPETGAWSLAYDSREAATALAFYNRLVTEPWTDDGGVLRRGYAYRDAGGAWAKWQRGDIAMTQGYMDEEMFTVINPEVTGLAPIPKGPTGLRGSELNSRMLALYSDIDDPVVRDAAWEFIRFFGSKEASEIRTRVLVRAGMARFVHPDRLREFGYDALVRLSPPEWTEVYRIAVETGRPEPYGPDSNIAYDQLSLPLQEATQLALADELPEDRESRLDVFQILLSDSKARAEQEMLGIKTPEQAHRETTTALLVLIAVAAAYAVLIRMMVTTYSKAAAAEGSVGKRQKGVWTVLLLLPALAGITLWQVVPLLRGSAMAFQDYRLLGTSTWAGLENFGEVLFDAAWWESVSAAIRYTLWVLGLTFLPPLLLAILLQETPKGKLFFRVVFYLPAVVSGLIVILLWKLFYEESEFGILNAVVMRIPAGVHLFTGLAFAWACAVMGRRLLRQDSRLWAGIWFLAGLGCFWTGGQLAGDIFLQADTLNPLATLTEPVRWLSNPETAMFACVLPLAWGGMGPGCLIYLAALKGIDEQSYEAADLDGAGFADKLLFIVIPRLKPLLIINFLGVFIGAFFHAEANILAMTGGSAGTRVAGLHIFQQAYIYLKFGPATAMAWLLGAMLIGFTLWQLRMLARLEFKTTGND
jgi:multiple sugar transport system permease protein